MPEELLAKVAVARHCEAQQRLERLAQLRDEDRARLANHRLRRERVNSGVVRIWCEGGTKLHKKFVAYKITRNNTLN